MVGLMAAPGWRGSSPSLHALPRVWLRKLDGSIISTGQDVGDPPVVVGEVSPSSPVRCEKVVHRFNSEPSEFTAAPVTDLFDDLFGADRNA